jgi:hypothetical protein
MSATAINSYSDDIEANIAPLYAPLKTNVQGGRVRMAFFKVTLASQAAGEDIVVAIVPKGARILGGEIVANGALANSAQVSVGLMGKDGTGYVDDSTATDRISYTSATVTGPLTDSVACLKAAAVLSTTLVPFAITMALGYGYEAQKELYLTISTSVGTVGTEIVYGVLYYVVD